MRNYQQTLTTGLPKPQRGPSWPHLPWSSHGGRYRLPMRGPDNEAIAVRIEALWKRDDLSDADRRALLQVARILGTFDLCAGYVLGGLAPVLTGIESVERKCGLLVAVN